MFNRRMLLTSAAVMPLAACAGTSTDKLPPDVLAFISKVQAIVIKGCGFLPAVEGVLALIGGAIPAVATVEVVADWICRAIPPAAGLTPRAGQTVTLTVQGKPVAGVFVR